MSGQFLYTSTPSERAAIQTALVMDRYAPARPTTVHAAPPTITYSATAPAAGRTMLAQLENAQVIGGAPVYSSATSSLNFAGSNAQFRGVECWFYGTAITLGYRCAVSNGEKFQYFVDGQPCLAAPESPSIATAAGTFYYVTLTFGSAAWRKVEILGSYLNALGRFNIGLNDQVKTTAPRRKVMIIGDSFNEGSAAVTPVQIPPNLLALRREWNVFNNAIGGTGFVQSGSFTTFGSATRVALAAAFQPADILFMGSVNDDGLSGIQAAVAAALAAYRVACPYARFTVFGPQPTSATATLSANRQSNNVAVKAACDAAGVTFIDMIGNADGAAISAFSTAATYNYGDRVSYVGSIWRHDRDVASTYASDYPGKFNVPQFTLMTTNLYGTGQVGTTTGNGSRDVLLYSDSLHPTAQACISLADLEEAALLAA